VGQKVELEYNVETMRISDLPEDASAVSSFKRPNVLENIKTQSRVVDTEIKEDTGKITAELQSNKLKQMLSQIKSS
jgi:hypothetical protein